MKLLIAIPTYETIRPETFKSIYGMQIPEGVAALFDYMKGYGAARARNMIAEEALRDGFDAVLMVDSDIVLPADALGFLLERDVPIVLGVYPRRGSAGGSEVFLPGRRDFTEENRVMDPPPARFAAKGGGMGCALIRSAVFRTLPRPWFDYVEYENGDVLSEDNYFCATAAAAGFAIEADGRVRCTHIGACEWRF